MQSQVGVLQRGYPEGSSGEPSVCQLAAPDRGSACVLVAGLHPQRPAQGQAGVDVFDVLQGCAGHVRETADRVFAGTDEPGRVIRICPTPQTVQDLHGRQCFRQAEGVKAEAAVVVAAGHDPLRDVFAPGNSDIVPSLESDEPAHVLQSRRIERLRPSEGRRHRQGQAGNAVGRVVRRRGAEHVERVQGEIRLDGGTE